MVLISRPDEFFEINFQKMFNYLCILLRKTKSLISFIGHSLSTFAIYASAFGNPGVIIRSGCRFGKSVRLVATDGGVISIGKNSYLGDDVRIVVQKGRVTIGDDVFIGEGSIIVCHDDIFIGSDSLIAEYVVIRDQDHSIGVHPVRSAGFHTSPIHIGKDVWIGCKASILRGASVGDRCVVGAHALVRSGMEKDMLVVGVPARALRSIRNNP